MTTEAPPPKKYPPIWVFDVNRRRYAPDGKGGPIWRHHWVLCEVVGETRVSWIVEGYGRIPKKGNYPKSEAEVDRRAWVHDHSRSVCEKLVRLAETDPGLLGAVADLVGYEPRMPRKP